MSKKLSILAAALLAFTWGCADQPTAARAPAAVRAESTSALRDRYLVMFRPGADTDGHLAERLLARHGGTLHFRYSHAIQGFAATLPAAAAEALRHDPNVQYVEPDAPIVLSGVQVGPPWGLDRIDQHDLPLDGYYNWDALNGYYNSFSPLSGAGVTVYVIDTGVQTTHPEFQGRATTAWDAFPSEAGYDSVGHGTHVAGIVAASTYGVAKGASIVSVKVTNAFASIGVSGTTSTLVYGVDTVTALHNRAHTPAVANVSIRVAASSVLDAAVRNSIASGVVYVVGAGNDNDDACNYSPGRVAEAITVGATREDDWRWTETISDPSSPSGVRFVGSNYGTCLDVFAPGANILSTWKNGGTATLSGTSMAAPHVAGWAARYLQRFPTSTPAQVQQALISGATLNHVSNYGLGTPNRLLFTGQ